MAIKIVTGKPWIDDLCPRIESFFQNNVVAFFINGRIRHGYRCPDGIPLWLRDHAHQMKAFKYWDSDMTSALDHFLETQRNDGSFWDLYFWAPESGNDMEHYDEQQRIKYHRCSMEADVEYHAVDACHMVWQATGDDRWIQDNLPRLEKGLKYVLSDPNRWDPIHQVVKRPFTIDTWDFEYMNPQRTWKKELLRMCIMHGDNSGYYKAFCLMAKLYDHLGNEARAAEWKERAEGLKERTNQVCWNGAFYTHQVHLDPVDVPDVNEDEILSLSNTYDMNRGIASHEQAASIIREYLSRREKTRDQYFAEWFSIQPAFPVFLEGRVRPGEYVNGGVLPLVGGELARASFEHGFESYGVDILHRYAEMITRDNAAYLWYHPDGSPGLSKEGYLFRNLARTDGWGSSAMVYALAEGLAGIEDRDKCFTRITLSPRWIAADVDKASVELSYPAGTARVSYTFRHDPEKNSINVTLTGSPTSLDLHLLLPDGAEPRSVHANGKAVPFRRNVIENSTYVDAAIACANVELDIMYEIA